jgi:hypothetical protein
MLAKFNIPSFEKINTSMTLKAQNSTNETKSESHWNDCSVILGAGRLLSLSQGTNSISLRDLVCNIPKLH